MTEFAISDLAAGGGMLGICPLPGRFRPYPDDLAAVLAWHPDAVLTMATRPEMDRHGAGRFGADLRARGVTWHFLPVPDFGTPPDGVRAVWSDLVPDLVTVLARGGRVLAHCYGGCGRSGMALLRLMVEAGEPGPDALHRLRMTRACAVETQAQMEWAFRGQLR